MTDNPSNRTSSSQAIFDSLSTARRMADEPTGDLVADPALLEMLEAVVDDSLSLDAANSSDPERAAVIRDLLPTIQQLRSPHLEFTEIPILELDDYRIVRELGKGGMGVVYEAIEGKFNRRVAVKILPLTLDRRRINRFKKEAEAAAQLDHRHIVPVHTTGQAHGVHYYVMKYVEGFDLARLIRAMLLQREPAEQVAWSVTSHPSQTTSTSLDREMLVDTQILTTLPDSLRPLASSSGAQQAAELHRVIARIGMQAALALHHAHEQEVVHRDIKPANLMLDAEGNVWVTDFGLALLRGKPGVTENQPVGTLRYMSPEQTMPDRVAVDYRTDIYSLGVTLYELLTLRPAMNGAQGELLQQIAFQDPPAPRKLDRRIPDELQLIVTKAMSKHPDDRYQSAIAMAEDLRLFTEGLPIKTEPPKLHQRFFRFVRTRQRLMTNVAAATVFTLVVALASSAIIFGAFTNEKVLRQGLQATLKRSESRRLAAEAKLLEEADTAGAALLAVEALKRDDNAEARTVLNAALDDLHELRTFDLQRGAIVDADVTEDRERLVFCFAARGGPASIPATLVDVESGRTTELRDQHVTQACAFGPQGIRVLTVSRTSTGKRIVSLWDAGTGNVLARLTGARLQTVTGRSFAPTGSFVVAPADGNTAKAFSTVDGKQAFQLDHSAEVVRAEYALDGEAVVTLDAERTFRFWDPVTQQRLAELNVGPDTAFKIRDFRVIGDNLLVSLGNQRLEIWNWREGEKRSIAGGPTITSHALAVSSDQNRLAVRSGATVRFFELPSLEETGVPVNLESTVGPISLSPSGKWLAAHQGLSARRYQIAIYSTKSGTQRADFRGHSAGIRYAEFVSDEQLLSAGEDGTGRLWSVASYGDEQFIAEDVLPTISIEGNDVLLPQAPGPGAEVVFNGGVQQRLPGRVFKTQCETRFVCAQRQSVQVLDNVTFEAVAEAKVAGADVHDARLSADGRWMVIVRRRNPPLLLDVESGETRTLTSSVCLAADVSPNSETLVAALDTGVLLVRQLGTGEQTQVDFGRKVGKLRFTPDGQSLVSIDDLRQLTIWDVDLQRKQPLESVPGDFFKLAMRANDVIAWGAGIVAAWDLESRTLLGSLQIDQLAEVAVHPQRSRVGLAHRTAVEVWDYRKGERAVISETGARRCAYDQRGEQLLVVRPPRTGFRKDVGPSQLVALGMDGTAKLQMDLGNGAEHALVVRGGRLFISGVQHGIVKLNIATGRELLRVTGHSRPISFAASYGKGLVTASLDHSVVLWSKNGQPLRRLDLHQAPIEQAYLDVDQPSGPPVLVSVDASGLASVWDLSNGEVLRTRQGESVRPLPGAEIPAMDYDPATDRLLVTGPEDKSIVIWNTRSGEEQTLAIKGVVRRAALAKTRAGLCVVVQGADGKRRTLLYRQLTAAPLELLHREAPYQLEFRPGGDLLATASRGKVQVWDAVRGQPQRSLAFLNPRVCFGPDGDKLVVGNFSEFAVYDVESGKKWVTLKSHEQLHLTGRWRFQHSSLVSDDGSWLVAATHSRRLRRWSLLPDRASERLPRELSEAEMLRHLAVEDDAMEENSPPPN